MIVKRYEEEERERKKVRECERQTTTSTSWTPDYPSLEKIKIK